MRDSFYRGRAVVSSLLAILSAMMVTTGCSRSNGKLTMVEPSSSSRADDILDRSSVYNRIPGHQEAIDPNKLHYGIALLKAIKNEMDRMQSIIEQEKLGIWNKVWRRCYQEIEVLLDRLDKLDQTNKGKVDGSKEFIHNENKSKKKQNLYNVFYDNMQYCDDNSKVRTLIYGIACCLEKLFINQESLGNLQKNMRSIIYSLSSRKKNLRPIKKCCVCGKESAKVAARRKNGLKDVCTACSHVYNREKGKEKKLLHSFHKNCLQNLYSQYKGDQLYGKQGALYKILGGPNMHTICLACRYERCINLLAGKLPPQETASINSSIIQEENLLNERYNKFLDIFYNYLIDIVKNINQTIISGTQANDINILSQNETFESAGEVSIENFHSVNRTSIDSESISEEHAIGSGNNFPGLDVLADCATQRLGNHRIPFNSINNVNNPIDQPIKEELIDNELFNMLKTQYKLKNIEKAQKEAKINTDRVKGLLQMQLELKDFQANKVLSATGNRQQKEQGLKNLAQTLQECVKTFKNLDNYLLNLKNLQAERINLTNSEQEKKEWGETLEQFMKERIETFKELGAIEDELRKVQFEQNEMALEHQMIMLGSVPPSV